MQRSSGGLSIPLCAFQGTVSLQAPTGKTLSLSTYEVSSDGLKISPNNAKKVKAPQSSLLLCLCGSILVSGDSGLALKNLEVGGKKLVWVKSTERNLLLSCFSLHMD